VVLPGSVYVFVCVCALPLLCVRVLACMHVCVSPCKAAHTDPGGMHSQSSSKRVTHIARGRASSISGLVAVLFSPVLGWGDQ